MDTEIFSQKIRLEHVSFFNNLFLKKVQNKHSNLFCTFLVGSDIIKADTQSMIFQRMGIIIMGISIPFFNIRRCIFMDHFELVSEFEPTGDQPEAIRQLVSGFKQGNQFETLLGVTGSGKIGRASCRERV